MNKMIIKSRRYVVISVLLTLFVSSQPAFATHKDPKTNINFFMLEFIMVKFGLGLTQLAFDWVAHQLGLTDQAPKEPLDDENQARIVIDEALRNHLAIRNQINELRSRFTRLPNQILFRILQNRRAPNEVRLVAENVLRQERIIPMYEAARYDDIADLGRRFRRAGGRGYSRTIYARLFAYHPASSQAELSEPTIYHFGRINGNLGGPAAITRAWSIEIDLPRRLKEIKKYAHQSDDETLLQIQLEILNIEDQIRLIGKTWNEERIKLLHALHSAIMLFETLIAPDENGSTQTEQKQKPLTAIQEINQALKRKGTDRFPISGDFELDALVLGFQRDADSIGVAEHNDNSDNEHRLSKGGVDRFIRGGIIISRDKDKHAGDAYKVHVRFSSGKWKYFDTAVLVEIDGAYYFLCLDRKKKHGKEYWLLFDADGNWFRLSKEKEDATIEPLNKKSSEAAA